MAKDKKVNDKSKERDLSNKDRFEILLEDMRHEFKAVGEGVSMVIKKIDVVDHKVDRNKEELEKMIMFSNKVLHEKIDNVEAKLTEKIDGVDKRLVNVEQKVDKIDNRLANVEQDVGVLKQDVKNIDNRLINVEQKVTKIDTKLDKVIERQDKQEVRQDKQEVKLDEVYHKVFAEGAGF